MSGRKKSGQKRPATILGALEEAGARPPDTATQGAKRKYAEAFSNALAKLVANILRPDFPGILPGREGELTESRAPSSRGFKKLDVNYSTNQLGLALGVSIKTISHRDKKGAGRYSHNYPRVDDELRAEAMDYHVRQPYAVLIAIYFMPVDACDDGKGPHPSSFGSCVKKFHFRAGRSAPSDSPELFERIFVGLYEPTGASRGDVRFFDVTRPPPKQGRPDLTQLPDLRGLARLVADEFAARNPQFQWAAE